MSVWPSFSVEEIQAVTKVLESGKVNYWTGQEGRLFEKEFASYIGTNHAIAVSNGTVALELCLRALQIGDGDEVIVTSRTFLASASSIVMCGAKPVFADVDMDSQNINLKTIKEKVTSKTKAIICVHLAGWPCEMPGIMAFAEENNFFVIEDCAQAHGASIDDKKVGSWGHMAAFSFCQDKIMTAGGEGGMVTTSDEYLWKKAWAFKDHGKSYDSVYNKKHPPGFRWLHETFGTNWRMSEMQAAIGRIQLKKLDSWLQLRNTFAKIYRDFFSQFSFIHVPWPEDNIKHACYKFYIFIKRDYLQIVDRDRLIEDINSAGVRCFSGSCSEIYKEKCFDYLPAARPINRLVNAKLLGESSVMFEVHPTLSEDCVKSNIAKIKTILHTFQITALI
jgi:dTDP-4-amino-4,6-dideoxygalactose transaminase